MPACKICATECTAQHGVYWICSNCACWFQDPLPPKVYHDPDAPLVMSEGDKDVNRALAEWLFHHVMRGDAGRVLDIGCGPYPFLANCFLELGCGVDAIDGEVTLSPGLRSFAIAMDFENAEDVLLPHGLRLVTLVHNFEHHYNPLASLRKMRRIIADDGRVFMRLPDHTVPGFEMHLKPAIHPYMHCLDSILEALKQTGTFVVEETHAMEGAGQRDIVLRPI